MFPLAVGRVANNRVGDMFHMAAKLVATARNRLQFNECVTAARITVYRDGELYFRQFSEVGQGILWFHAALCASELIRIALAGQLMINDSL